MGLFDGLLGGGGGGSAADDPYADILTPAQRNQMQVQGLLAMAGAFAQAGMPSRLPVPFGSALGSAAAALGTGQEAGMKTALENALAAQKVRDLRSLADYRKKTLGDLDPTSPLSRAIAAITAPGGTAAPAAPSAGGAPPAGTYPTPGASPAAPAAAGAPLTMDLPYAPGGGGGLLGPGDGGAEGEYGGGQKVGGLLGPAPPAQRAGAAVGPVDKYGQPAPPGYEFGLLPNGKPGIRAVEDGTSGSSTAPAEPGPGAGGDTPWGPTFAQQAASRTGPARGETPEMTQLIERAAAERGISPDVLRGLIKVESGFKPNIVSPAGAVGLAQLMPGTARALGVTDSTDPAQAIPAAAQYLRQGLDAQGGDINRALMYYHGGPNTAMWGTKTQAYPGAVLAAAGGAPALTTQGSGSGGGGEDAGWGPTFAQGGPDRVIPSGAGGNPPAATLAQYAPGGGGAPGAGAMPAMPQVPVPPGADAAKMNALILELARRNAASEVLGLGNPYNSLLTVLQGSPQYKAAVEAATETARRAAGLPFVQPEAREKALGGYEVDVATRTAQANLDRVTNQIKDMGAAALDPAGTLLINGPNGPVERQVNRLQKAQAQAGFDVPEIGFKGMNGPVPAGKIPGVPGAAGTGAGAPGPQAQGATPGGPGTLYDKPVFTPAEETVGKGSAEDIFKARTMAQDAAQSIETTKEARKLLDSGVFTGAGSDRVTALAKIGNALKLTGPTTQETVANTEAYFATIAQNVGRIVKQFGSGSGLSDADREYAAKMAAGQQTLDEASIRKMLDINDRAGFNVINRHNASVAGIRPGVSLTPLTVPVPTPYQRTYPEGFIIQNSQGEQRVMRNGNWEPVTK